MCIAGKLVESTSKRGSYVLMRFSSKLNAPTGFAHPVNPLLERNAGGPTLCPEVVHGRTTASAMFSSLVCAGVVRLLMAPRPLLTGMMLTIHRQPTTTTLQLPPELLHKIITWVIAQSVHSICVLSDNVEWELRSMRTLCLVSSAFRDITLEVACKAFAMERRENQSNYPRCDCEACGSLCVNLTFFSSSAMVSAKLRSLHSYKLKPRVNRALDHDWPSIFLSTKDDLVSGYSVHLAAVNLRHISVGIGAWILQRMYQLILPLLEGTLTDCGNIEPSGVGALLSSLLCDDIHVVKIGMVLTGYILLGQG